MTDVIENEFIGEIDDTAQGTKKTAEQSSENRGDCQYEKSNNGIIYNNASRCDKGENCRKGIETKKPSSINYISCRVGEYNEKRNKK